QMAFDADEIEIGTPIRLRVTQTAPPLGFELPEGVELTEDGIASEFLVETTLGRALFNDALPPNYPFVNTVVDKKQLSGIVNDLAERYTKVQVAASLDTLKDMRSEEHTSELQSRENLVCRLLLEKKDIY